MQANETARRGKTFQQLVGEAKTRIQEMTADELRALQAEGREFVLLDVREPGDFENGHIPGAVNLPRGILELEIDEVAPDQDKLVVAYCGGGSRSALAADTLQTMGYNNVVSLAGGWRGWNA